MVCEPLEKDYLNHIGDQNFFLGPNRLLNNLFACSLDVPSHAKMHKSVGLVKVSGVWCFGVAFF